MQGDKALAVFAEMEAAGLPQSTHSFNIAIAACASEPGTSLKVCLIQAMNTPMSTPAVL